VLSGTFATTLSIFFTAVFSVIKFSSNPPFVIAHQRSSKSIRDVCERLSGTLHAFNRVISGDKTREIFDVARHYWTLQLHVATCMLMFLMVVYFYSSP